MVDIFSVSEVADALIGRSESGPPLGFAWLHLNSLNHGQIVVFDRADVP